VQAFRVFMSRRSALDLSVECQRASAGPGAPSLGLSPQPVFAPHLATRESHVARTNPPASFCAPQASADALGGEGAIDIIAARNPALGRRGPGGRPERATRG
jgi:hypothetical protein